jgi:hypothetical protein
MANGIIQVPPDSTGKKVDAASLDVGADSVIRQRIILGDNSATAEFAEISLGALKVFGTMNISATVVAVIQTPFSINAISATVTVAGKIELTAGTANIGFINNISATVEVHLIQGTNNIGGVSLVAGTANIGFINHISATLGVRLVAGTDNFGTLNNISATVATGVAYVTEKTTGSLVQVGDSANAAIRVNVVAGAAAGGTSMADGTGFVAGTTAFTPSGGVMDDAATGVVAEGSAGAVRITPHRAFHNIDPKSVIRCVLH